MLVHIIIFNAYNRKLDKELHDYLLSFPIVYEVPNINLYVVHGGLLPEKPITDQEPFDIMNMVKKHNSSNFFFLIFKIVCIFTQNKIHKCL